MGRFWGGEDGIDTKLDGIGLLCGCINTIYVGIFGWDIVVELFGFDGIGWGSGGDTRGYI